MIQEERRRHTSKCKSEDWHQFSCHNKNISQQYDSKHHFFISLHTRHYSPHIQKGYDENAAPVGAPLSGVAIGAIAPVLTFWKSHTIRPFRQTNWSPNRRPVMRVERIERSFGDCKPPIFPLDHTRSIHPPACIGRVYAIT